MITYVGMFITYTVSTRESIMSYEEWTERRTRTCTSACDDDDVSGRRDKVYERGSKYNNLAERHYVNGT